MNNVTSLRARLLAEVSHRAMAIAYLRSQPERELADSFRRIAAEAYNVLKLGKI